MGMLRIQPMPAVWEARMYHRDRSYCLEVGWPVKIWRPVTNRAKMGIVKTWKSRVSQKTVQDYGNRTADIFLAMPELGRWGILSLGGSYYLYELDT